MSGRTEEARRKSEANKRKQKRAEKVDLKPKEEARPIAPLPTSMGQRWRSARRYIRITALIFSVPSSIFAAFALVQPKVSLAAASLLDPSDVLSALFAIKNEGHVPIYNVILTCHVNSIALKDVNITGFGGPPIKRLWPSQTATRDCRAIVGADNENAVIKASVAYSWPIPFLSSKIETIFTSRATKSGYVLVPDVGL